MTSASSNASSQDIVSPFKKHKKNILMFSNASKPIYTRYDCDEKKLIGITGVLVALISFAGRQGQDKLRCITAGSHKVVFLLKDPIYCVAVAQTSESTAQLMSQLEYMHSQVISILTVKAHTILKNTPSFDLRPLLGGTNKQFKTLAQNMNNVPAFLLNSIHCLRLPSSVRNAVGHIIQACREGDLFYAMLIAKGQLVSLVRQKRYILYPPDLHLIINFVNSRAESFRSSEAHLTPICLPMFNDSGFLHLYVCYLTEDICFLLFSDKADDFYKMSASKDKILAHLQTTNQMLKQIEECVKHQHYTVSESGIPDLRHFIYKSHTLSQMTSPEFSAPYTTKQERKRLFRLYQEVHQRVYLLDKDRPHKVYYHRSESETLVAWVTAGFDLFAVFGPVIPKSVAIKACNTLLKWIKQDEPNLFIHTSPVWGK